MFHATDCKCVVLHIQRPGTIRIVIHIFLYRNRMDKPQCPTKPSVNRALYFNIYI